MTAVLITGANRGLGLEFARQYVLDGWQVFATCRNPGTASQLRAIAENGGGKLTVVAMDVTDPASVQNAATQVRDIAIDVLINNAGTGGEPGQTTGNVDYDNWVRVLDVNTLGPLRLVEAFTDHIARSKRKIIVTITSGMGSLGANTEGGSIAYRSSKAAVNMVMRSAAVDLAPRGITCVLVNPGWVKTDMGGPDAPRAPQESVAAIRKLIGRIGPKDSGKFFNYDGGKHQW
jgi:NAD(P)-dependent dehydrogenase (short-subunit alcohol dehydrogenase family)